MTGAGLSLTVDARPVERVPAALVIAGVFESELPLRGTAGRVDWRLCGLLSDLARRGRLSGGAGEFTLVGCDERLACEGLLLRGLGARADFAADVFRRAVADVFARAAALEAPTVAIGSLGIAADEWARHVDVFVEGAVVGVGDSPMSARLCLDPEETERVGRELARCCIGTDVEVELPPRDRAPDAFRSVRPGR